jgi:hypothetical protein
MGKQAVVVRKEGKESISSRAEGKREAKGGQRDMWEAAACKKTRQ